MRIVGMGWGGVGWSHWNPTSGLAPTLTVGGVRNEPIGPHLIQFLDTSRQSNLPGNLPLALALGLALTRTLALGVSLVGHSYRMVKERRPYFRTGFEMGGWVQLTRRRRR